MVSTFGSVDSFLWRVGATAAKKLSAVTRSSNLSHSAAVILVEGIEKRRNINVGDISNTSAPQRIASCKKSPVVFQNEVVSSSTKNALLPVNLGERNSPMDVQRLFDAFAKRIFSLISATNVFQTPTPSPFPLDDEKMKKYI